MYVTCAHIAVMATLTAQRKASTPTKEERLVARVHAADKTLIERGADLAGLSVGSFLVTHARKAAEELLREQEVIRLTSEESRRLVDALLALPKKPTKSQKEAVARYRKQVHSDVNPAAAAGQKSVALW